MLLPAVHLTLFSCINQKSGTGMNLMRSIDPARGHPQAFPATKPSASASGRLTSFGVETRKACPHSDHFIHRSDTQDYIKDSNLQRYPSNLDTYVPIDMPRRRSRNSIGPEVRMIPPRPSMSSLQPTLRKKHTPCGIGRSRSVTYRILPYLAAMLPSRGGTNFNINYRDDTDLVPHAATADGAPGLFPYIADSDS